MFKKFDSEVHALDLNKTRSWINAAFETLNCQKRYQSLFNRVKTTMIMGDKVSAALSISRYRRTFMKTSHFSEGGVGGRSDLRWSIMSRGCRIYSFVL